MDRPSHVNATKPLWRVIAIWAALFPIFFWIAPYIVSTLFIEDWGYMLLSFLIGGIAWAVGFLVAALRATRPAR
jgi:hypothetical protein